MVTITLIKRLINNNTMDIRELIAGGWIYCGSIKSTEGGDYEALRKKFLIRTDNEQRCIKDWHSGDGCDCYSREITEKEGVCIVPTPIEFLNELRDTECPYYTTPLAKAAGDVLSNAEDVDHNYRAAVALLESSLQDVANYDATTDNHIARVREFLNTIT